MGTRLLPGGLVAWLLLLVVMFTNGIVRVMVLQPRLGEEPARRVATLIGVFLVLAISWLYARRVAPARAGELLAVGALWLALTLAFEFGFGRLSGQSWEVLLADYDVARGRLWPLVLVATLFGPWLMGRMIHGGSDASRRA
jgi:hypothetical protein